MAQLVIGSTAMQAYLPNAREPKDFDVFTDEPIDGDTFWHPRFAEFWPEGTDRFATLDELYTIKVSHSYWELKNGSWNKHMFDIVELKKAGATLDEPLHKMLYSVWEAKHGRKRVNLNMDKEAFFTDAVKRTYDHDSIHYSVAYGDKPIYEDCYVDGEQVAMSMAKIKEMPFDQQVRLYREEIYATALERWVIPSDYTVSPRKAYADATKKTIVSLTKGWSAKFLVTNYEVFRSPDMDYVAHHLSKKDQLIKL